MPQKIAAAGFYRTGTTHVYNIVREIHKVSGISFERIGASGQALIDILDRSDNNFVIKTHGTFIPPKKEVKVVFCIRDPLDTICSNMRITDKGLAGFGPNFEKLDFDKISSEINQTFRWARRYEDRDDALVVKYEDFYGRSVDKARFIAEFLGFPSVNCERVARRTNIAAARDVMGTLSIEKGNDADATTQLRHNHIGRNGGKPGTYEVNEEFKGRVKNGIDGTPWYR